METKRIFIKGEEFVFDTLKVSDIDNLILVATQWVRDSDTRKIDKIELKKIGNRLKRSVNSHAKYLYFVIRNNDNLAIGMCGIRNPKGQLKKFVSGGKVLSKEIVNLFLDTRYRGKGLGKAFLAYCFTILKDLKCREVIWKSSSRYKESAWGFYNKVVGEPITIIENYFGEGLEALVWKKILF